MPEESDAFQEVETQPSKEEISFLVSRVNTQQEMVPYLDQVSVRYQNRLNIERDQKKLKEFGSAAAEVVIEHFDSGRLDFRATTKLLDIFEDADSREQYEKLLSKLSLDEWDVYDVLLRLNKINDKSSIPALSGFLDKCIDQAKLDIEGGGGHGKLSKHIGLATSVIDYIEGYEDIESINALEEKYEKLSSLKEKLKLIREDEIKHVLEPIQNLQPYITEEDLDEIASIELPEVVRAEAYSVYNSIIHSKNRYEVMNAPLNEIVLPTLVDEIIEGRVDINSCTLLVLERLSHHRNIAILQKLALRLSEGDSLNSDKLPGVMRLLSGIENKNNPKIFAEITRRTVNRLNFSADVNENRKLLHTISVGLSLVDKFGIDDKDLADLSGLYSKWIESYDVVHASQFESKDSPKENLKRKWSHDKVYIRGSAVFASLLDRGKDSVRDIDIFITTPYAIKQKIMVGDLESIDKLGLVMSTDAVERIKKWISENGFEDKKIQLVRLQEDAMDDNETFRGEPEILIWDKWHEQVLKENDEEEARRLFGSGEYDDYVNGGVVVGGRDFIEGNKILTPNQTLSRGLRVLDIAERFGLEYDHSLLETAEKAVKNGKIVISSFPDSRISNNPEVNQDPVIDIPGLKVFRDKRLRKLLLKEFPRLGQLYDEIDRAGGIKAYIRINYGEVYLQNRGFVRGYDINLANSPASIERQSDFIEDWYRDDRQIGFKFSSVEKISDEPGIPEVDSIKSLIEKGTLESAEIRRSGLKNTFIEGLSGRYRVELGAEDKQQISKKIRSYLDIMNLDWPDGVSMEEKVTKTLIKLGVNARNPILSQLETPRAHYVDLVISSKPEDVLGASTEKPWTSCTNLDGGEYSGGLYENVAAGSSIAYMMDGNRFLSRRLLIPGVTVDSFEKSLAIERMYGDLRYEQPMLDAIRKVCEGNSIEYGKRMITYPFSGRVHFDSMSLRLDGGNVVYDQRVLV